MTDRKSAQRARNAAGYQHVSGYTTTEEAPDIQSRLLTAEQVDAMAAEAEAAVKKHEGEK